jgi:MauM/NapG family ferredoxin protein
LGALIDFIDRFFFKTVRQNNLRPPQYFQKAKYIFLFAIFVIALAGALFPLFMDPISLLTRIATVTAYPLPSIFESVIKPFLGSLGAGNRRNIPFFYGSLGIGALFLSIIVGAFFDRRFWCQYVCPSGAFFGLLSRFALFRRTTSTATCGGCKACVKVCPTRAISDRNFLVTSSAECILCGKCVGIKKDCSAFRFGASKERSGILAGPDLGRRHLVTGFIAGTLLLPVIKADALTKRDNTGRLIRPPGAVPDALFNARCLACGQCMKACPTNALQPCTLDDGLSRLSTPKVAPRIGGCEEKCYLCGHVCPTNAIRKLTYEEKRFAKIGTAVIDRHRCLAWEQKKECLVCDEVCPYNAIVPRTVETTKGAFKVPVVDEDICIGCGMCEQQCPIFDTAAIVVFKFGENRRLTGPYVSEPQKKMILEKRSASDGGLNTGFGSGAIQSNDSAPQTDVPDTTHKKTDGSSPSSGFSF